MNLTTHIDSVDKLEEALSEPTDRLVEFVKRLHGPLVVLGAAGKMGPTLCLLANRAAEAAGKELDVIAVSRFSSPGSARWFEDHGIRTLSADLLRAGDYKKLPDAENVIFLVGQKFGTSDNPSLTWAVNTIVPARVSERYRSSRIVALSTGNVYPLVPITSRGSTESDPPAPKGEYANACLARERIFEFSAERFGTRSTLVRLNYALELRYGVLVDIATRIKETGRVDVTMGHLNFIWQRDANERVIRSLDLATNPPCLLNLTGRQTHSVRALAEALAREMNRSVEIVGKEADTAFLSDASSCVRHFGDSQVTADELVRLTARWIDAGLPLLGKPTHFEQRDGKY